MHIVNIHKFERRRPTNVARQSARGVAVVVILLLSVFLTACSGGASADQAHANKQKLDNELSRARNELSIPTNLLAPIVSQEQSTTKGDGGFSYNYDTAASKYSSLLTQLTQIEQTALQTTQDQAKTDMQAFADVLNERRGDGFSEVPAYQQRFDDAEQLFSNAKTPDDYAHVSDIASGQTQALQALWPAFQELQLLQSVLTKLQGAGINIQLGQDYYNRDLTVFRAAETAEHYQQLTSIIDAHIMQVQAGAATAQPYVAKVLLDSFKARIDLLTQYGDTTHAATYQKQHDDDAAQLSKALTLAEFSAIATTITSQSKAMDSLLVREKAQYDYKQFDTLVHSPDVAGKMMINESGYDNYTKFQVAYEYLDKDNGIGDAADMLSKAHTDTQFQAADFRITSLMENLRAMLDNYDPATDQVNMTIDSQRFNAAHEKPHPTDLQLMDFYKVTSGKVIVISLREQTARFYNAGNMEAFTYVTTGRPGDTSIPGFWTALNRHSPTNPNPTTLSPTPIPPGYGDMFTSPDPIPGSPGYYDPTPIHYDVAYHEFGYWLHDAWWRHAFGPETNLPHYDPAAFNGGSHGCVNLPYTAVRGVNSEWVYSWTPIGTPIIIY